MKELDFIDVIILLGGFFVIGITIRIAFIATRDILSKIFRKRNIARLRKESMETYPYKSIEFELKFALPFYHAFYCEFENGSTPRDWEAALILRKLQG